MTQTPQIFLVALPLGNPDDLTRRAAQALEAADWIFCEDTRKLKGLVESANINLKPEVKITSIPGSEEWNFNWSVLESGQHSNIILCSDAGTPSLNDPGRALVLEAQKRKWPLVALPGPSAPVMALQWSGGFGLPFLFFGFAPKGGGKSWDVFIATLLSAKTFAFFDTRYNILSTLNALVDSGAGERKCFLAREMTKTHEELWLGSVSEILSRTSQQLHEHDAIGELTLLIEGEGPSNKEGSWSDNLTSEERALKILSISDLAPKSASKVLSELSGLSKQEAYKLMIENKKDNK